MTHRPFPIVALVGLLALGAAASAQTPEISRGQTLVERHCGGCHAVGRADASPEPAAPPLRELNLRYEPEMLGEALAEGILTGHPMMPEFRFPPDDVRAIIEYLNSIQTRRPA